jgi:UDP-N-acetyl-D-mannosaminouronate:lipid I N-acetyl-D-mannosaminouronosyltransferase
VIDTANYRYADGIRIVRSIKKKYSANVERITGVDLWHSMMRRAGQDRIPVFLLGGRPEVLNTVQQRLKEGWMVEIVGSQDGYFDDNERQTLLNRIRDSGAHIVTVVLGSPKQELFIHECSRLHPDALCMTWAAHSTSSAGTLSARRSCGASSSWNGSTACFRNPPD